MQTVRVLAMSASTVIFREAEGEPTLIMELEDALRRERPEVGWEVSGELLYTTSTMRTRALRLHEKHSPAIVLLRPTGRMFLHDDVASRIRERWPALHKAAVSIADFLDRFSGGRAKDGSYQRRLLFTAPRWLAERVIGVAPQVPAEDSARYVCETIDGLIATEACEPICRISAGNTDSNLNEAELRRRVAVFTNTIREHCERRHVPFMDNRDIYASLGLAKYSYSPDRIHPAGDMRRIEAEVISRDIVTVFDTRLAAAATGV